MKPVGVITLTDILTRVCAVAEGEGGPNAEGSAVSAGTDPPSLSALVMTIYTLAA
jgi:hypothetical protein